MKRISFVFAALFAFVAFVAFPMAEAKNDFSIGTVVENFKLPDVNGKEQTLNSLKGKNGSVVVFLSVQCPVVKGYDERINQVAEEAKAMGVNFIGINSNSTETPEAIKAHAAEKYKFPVLLDKGNVIADKFNATATPEMFFFDANNKLVYHGAIDNDRSGKNISAYYLKSALTEQTSGKAITTAETKAFGCTIKRVGM